MSPGRNPSIDRLRGVGALCVVLIHATPLIHSSRPAVALLGWALLILCQAAVPYFFLVSGYHLARKWSRGTDAAPPLRSTARILLLYVPWFLLYLGIDIGLGRPVDPVATLRRFLSFSDGRLPISGFHLWFLPSLVYGQWALWLSFRFLRGPMPALLAGIALYLSLGACDLVGIRLPFGLVAHEFLGMSLLPTALGAWFAVHGSRWSIRPSFVAAIAAAQLLEAGAWRLAGVPVPAFQILRQILPLALLAAAVGGTIGFGRTLDRILDALGKESTGIYVLHLAFLVAIPWSVLVPSGFVRDNFVVWPCALALAWATSRLLRTSKATSWLVA